MSCACGHHAPTMTHDCNDAGAAIELDPPLVALEGTLTCTDTAQMMTALSLLPDHMSLSREEPGCLRFDIWQDENPMVWNLSELFVDDLAFEAHQARTAQSDWGRDGTELLRDFDRRQVFPVLREETKNDHDAIDQLLAAAFKGQQEADLVRALRDDGDLALSLVAVGAGQVLGHVALSPISAEQPAYALAPVAVSPKLQSRGIGAALITAALEWAGVKPIVVLGDPAYYGRFGFAPTDLQSPYAGPNLMAVGKLSAGTRIIHAPAFSGI
ncbi:GNAT family N-acetyltransferase [Paracoccus sp. Z330]|uniref:GNAT family N-acetyltransferase n=1 Tax=Paracoccus onchidii TaxID=3017813 RepID=A0ABT4ZDF4_9RHOB|nr:GNAT family N-acetyltransferase [Paracoccus onchidii]MDB6177008.1 GNAT family N-acetyltransferase [Paracoccus onchidii]